MLDNPTKIVVNKNVDGKKTAGTVYAYGHDTESIESLVNYLSGRKNVTSVEIENDNG